MSDPNKFADMEFRANTNYTAEQIAALLSRNGGHEIPLPTVGDTVAAERLRTADEQRASGVLHLSPYDISATSRFLDL